MDPLSIATAVDDMFTCCAKVSTGLHGVISRYKQSSLLIRSICAECSIIRVSLGQIEKLLRSDEGNEFALTVLPNDKIRPCLDVALTGCSLVLSCLEEELDGMGGDSASAAEPRRRIRRPYTWDDSRMKDLLDALRGQQTVVGLLFVLLQSESLREVQELLKVKNNSLNAVAARTSSLRERYPDAAAHAATVAEEMLDSESILLETAEDASQQFDFDEDVTDLMPYQRLALVSRAVPGSLAGQASGSTFHQPPTGPAFQNMRQMRQHSGVQNPSQFLAEQQRMVTMLTNKLRSAVEIGDATAAAALLKQGAEVTVPFAFAGQNITVLHSAVSQGHIGLVKLLASFGSDVNAATPEFGITPLHVAVLKGHSQLGQILIDLGADLEAGMRMHVGPGMPQPTPVTVTSTYRENDSGTWHRSNVDDFSGFRPLHLAAIYNRPGCARLLLENGAERDPRAAKWNNTPLHFTAVFGTSDVAEVLIRYGADQLALDSRDFPVFHLGKAHQRQQPPHAWGPNLIKTAPPGVPSYVMRKD